MNHGPCDYITCGLYKSTLLPNLSTTVLTLTLIPYLHLSHQPIVLLPLVLLHEIHPLGVHQSMMMTLARGAANPNVKLKVRHWEWVKHTSVRKGNTAFPILLKHMVLLIYFSLSHFWHTHECGETFLCYKKMCSEPDDKWPRLFGLSVGKDTKNRGIKATWRAHMQSKFDNHQLASHKAWRKYSLLTFKYMKNLKNSTYRQIHM